MKSKIEAMECAIAKHISLESNLMGLIRKAFVGKVFDRLTDAESDLVQFAVAQKWLKVAVDPNVRYERRNSEFRTRYLVLLDQTPEELHVENCFAKDREMHTAVHHIIWPDDMMVTGEQLMRWANDDVDNGEHEGPKPATVQDAIEILQEVGSVTFGDTK